MGAEAVIQREDIPAPGAKGQAASRGGAARGSVGATEEVACGAGRTRERGGGNLGSLATSPAASSLCPPRLSQPTTFPHPLLGRHSGPGLGGENETGGEETFPPFSPSPASAPWLPPSLPRAKGQRIATRNPIDWYEGPRGPELANDQAARDELIMEAICNFQ